MFSRELYRRSMAALVREQDHGPAGRWRIARTPWASDGVALAIPVPSPQACHSYSGFIVCNMRHVTQQGLPGDQAEWTTLRCYLREDTSEETGQETQSAGPRSNNDKRRLMSNPDPEYIAQLREDITYQGSSKHKKNPHLFGLTPFQGDRGDATLCDRDANFQLANHESIPQIIQRALHAGLVGEHGIIWAVADNGWIYEARLTNIAQTEYHGYPVRSTEPIAELVYERFRDWAQENGNQMARHAARQCKTLYGFR